MYFYIILEKRLVKTMVQFELKKIFQKGVNRIVLILLAAVTLAGSCLAIRDVRYYKEDGSLLTGIKAARQLKEEQNKWKGYITEDVLRQVVEENKAANDSSKEADEALYKRQGFEDIRNMINIGFSEVGNYDYYLCDNISPDKAAGLYERRIFRINEEIKASEGKTGNGLSEKEREYLQKQYESLKTPLYYEYAEGWKALMDSQYLSTLMTITIVIIGFFISGIFSDEFRYKADSIFFSARLGRNKAIGAKMKAGFITVTAVYWCTMLLFSAIILFLLGFGGAGRMIQTGRNFSSIYNLTYFRFWLFTLLGGYIGTLFILMLSMLVSVKSRSAVVAITIPFALSCAPMFLGRIPAMTYIMNLFPDMLLRINWYVEEYLIYEIGGKVFRGYSILIPLYLLLFVLLIPVLYFGYKRVEVK